MKKRLVSLIALSFVLVLALAAPALALVKSDDSIVVSDGEIIQDDFFAAGNEVIINGTVEGDVYAAAQRISVSGTIEGDLIAAGNTIIISGEITDDVRALGSSVSLVGANVGDSVSVGASELSADKDSVIGGGIIFGGSLLSLDGSVGRGVTSGGESTRINSSVGRTSRIAANSITIGENAVIEGDLEYNSSDEATINGTITGETIRTDKDISIDVENTLQSIVLGFRLVTFIGAVIIGGLLLLIFPKIFEKADRSLKKPWRAFGAGLLVFFAAIPAIILLIVTIVGIPLAFIALAFWLLALYFSKFFVAYSVGKRILESIGTSSKKGFFSKPFVMLVFGLTVYYALSFVPVVGGLLQFAAIVLGLGMIASLYSHTKQTSS